MELREARSFRATTEAWLGQFILPLVFFILFTYTAINRAGLNPTLGGLGLFILFAVSLLDYLLPMVRNRVYCDAHRIEGSLNGRSFQVYWSEVLAAWMVQRKRRCYLCLGTRSGTFILPLRFLDERKIWQEVSRHVPPEALQETAVQRLPDYREWAAERDNLVNEGGEPHPVVDHWLIQVIGWCGLTFFLLSAAGSWRNAELAAGALFLGLALVNLVMLLNWGITEFTPQGIERNTLFGGWRIDWEEIRWIEIDPLNSIIVFVGENNQLVIPGPGVWGQAGKRNALTVLLAQAEKRRIPLRKTLLAYLRRSSKTRI